MRKYGWKPYSSALLQQTEQFLQEKFPETDIVCANRLHNFRDDVDSYPDLHENYEFYPCAYLMQRLAIFWNGDVTTCCMDYNNRFQLGNVKDQTLEEIWLSSKMQENIILLIMERHEK